ncbi:MAG: methylated-DNA--[protein]-cysteine S-methyltransferase [Phycisphaerales bacterium]|nr:methylated-DNA--[protein]-cysteine S-methyltransferase [Phycisphaerales bacterium]
MSMAFRVVETAAGPVGFACSTRGLRRVVLPGKSEQQVRRELKRLAPDAREDVRLNPDFAKRLVRYFRGEPVTFDDPTDYGDAGPFETAAWDACRGIGYGETSTYQLLAREVRKPRAARAIGAAMGRNPLPIVIPCHRVLRSDGSLGGYSGREGVSFKQRLLTMEEAASGVGV